METEKCCANKLKIGCRKYIGRWLGERGGGGGGGGGKGEIIRMKKEL